MKMKYFGLTETKLFNFHKIFKNGRRGGGSSEAPEPSLDLSKFLLLYIPVNSYGHGGKVSSPNYTFSWSSLNKRLTSN